MAVLDRIKDSIPRLMPLSSDYDLYDGEFKLYESDACNFEVLDKGQWYILDALHPYPELYEDEAVPISVIERAKSAIDDLAGEERALYFKGEIDSLRFGGRADPTEFLLDALDGEFENVRFINTTFKPGVIY